MTVLNANRWQNFVSLELPSSLPAVLAGMEVGIVLSIIGAVVGEYLGGATGLGYLLVASMNNYKVGMLVRRHPAADGDRLSALCADRRAAAAGDPLA